MLLPSCSKRIAPRLYRRFALDFAANVTPEPLRSSRSPSGGAYRIFTGRAYSVLFQDSFEVIKTCLHQGFQLFDIKTLSL